jgi:hypothetical protein
MRHYKNLIELFNAINSLNKRKDDDFFKIFRDNFTYNKDLILTYIVNKYNIDDIISAKLIDWDNFGQLINPRISTYGFFPDPINMAEVFEDFLTNSIQQ